METTPHTPRQTLSYLRNLFEERGIRPKTKLGQNFLIDLNILDVVVRAAELTKQDLALEIGSGTGSLTSRLCDEAGAVLSVEVDRPFYDLVQEMLYGRDHLVLLQHDVLESKNEIRRVVLHEIATLKERTGCTQIKLVANLPYAVAVPVLANFLLTSLPIERMVAMVQWEIAERLVAQPGTKDYGSLAVLVQSLAEVIPVRSRVPPSVFWPRPQVASAVVMIRPDPARKAQVDTIAGGALRFRGFLRDLYVHRRKNLRGALAHSPIGKRSREDVDRKLAELGIDGTLRAETLSVEDHLRLCAAFGA